MSRRAVVRPTKRALPGFAQVRDGASVARLLLALVRAKGTGLSVPVLVELTGMSRATIYRRLTMLRAVGWHIVDRRDASGQVFYRARP